MTVSLSIGPRSFTVSDSRLERLTGQDKAQATHMSLWDKIKDCFRSEKKQDVLNELYQLIHQDEQPSGSALEARINAFNRIKMMADPVSQNGFRTEDYADSENITFSVGSTVIYQQARDTLSVEDKQFLDRYYLQQANADEKLKAAFLEVIQVRFDGGLKVQGDDTAQLFKDIGRNSYEFDGVKLSVNDDVSAEKKEKMLKTFLEKLTGPQQKALNVTGSQLGVISLQDTLLLSSDSRLVFFGNPNKYEAKFYLDENSKLLTVHQKMMQPSDMDNEKFNILREGSGNNNAHWYPDLNLAATFTITTEGKVDLVDFKFNTQPENMPEPVHTEAREATMPAGMEKTSLLASKPAQGQLLTWLQQFISSTDRQWVDNINKDEDRKMKVSDAGALRDFSRQQLASRLPGHTAAEKQRMLTHLEGSFGQRLRAVSAFAAFRVAGNDAEPEIISMANRYPGALDDLIMVLREQLNKKEQPVPPAQELQELKTSEILALSQVGITPEMLEAW